MFFLSRSTKLQYLGREREHRKALHSSAPKIALVTRTPWPLHMHPWVMCKDPAKQRHHFQLICISIYSQLQVPFIFFHEQNHLYEITSCVGLRATSTPPACRLVWFCSSITNSILYMILHKQQMSQKLGGLKRYINQSLSWCFCWSTQNLQLSHLIDFLFIFLTQLYFFPCLGQHILSALVLNICHHAIVAKAEIRLLKPSFPRKIRSASRFGSNTDPW